jgi:hypothetical protein
MYCFINGRITLAAIVMQGSDFLAKNSISLDAAKPKVLLRLSFGRRTTSTNSGSSRSTAVSLDERSKRKGQARYRAWSSFSDRYNLAKILDKADFL